MVHALVRTAKHSLGGRAVLAAQFVAAFGSSAALAGNPPANAGVQMNYCERGDAIVFSCKLTDGAALKLCANTKASTVRLRELLRGKIHELASGIPAQVITPGKGYSTTLSWHSKAGQQTLSVDSGPFDAEADLDGRDCKGGDFETPLVRERSPKSGNLLSIFSLPEFGLSVPARNR